MVQAIIPLISKEFEKEMNNIRKQTNDATADKISKQIIDATMKLKKFAPDMTPLRVLETFKRNDLNSQIVYESWAKKAKADPADKKALNVVKLYDIVTEQSSIDKIKREFKPEYSELEKLFKKELW
jgi:hypothetical protein